ncbi:MAG: AI-2E family transporter [Actinomycetia bacterium]|nr:AI-2E family transporter [Actinomycetes bacterium]MCP5034519.1 AI-2E family transporter [Actinomycetes bacterium]
MSDTNVEEMTPPMPRGLNVLLTLAAGIIVVAGIRAFSGTVGPVFLAFVVVVCVYPIRDVLTRRGAPGWAATVALSLAAFGVLAAVLGALIWSASELAGLVTSDEYSGQLQQAQEDIADLATELGASGGDLENAVDSIDLASVAGQLTAALSGILGVFSALGVLVLTLVFVVLDAGKFSENLRHVATERPAIAEGLGNFASTTRSYFVVSSIFGLIVAIFDTVALFALGIPLALVWGLLSLITNYIPNIGFVIGLVPPTLLAFLEGGWSLALWVIIIYSTLNVIIQSVIQPKFVGDAVGLSVTLTFVSLLFWGWVLGPLGALLAVPLTLLAKALLIDIDPTTQWASPLIALDRRPPPESLPFAGQSDSGE